jgi:hypothetical protein
MYERAKVEVIKKKKLELVNDICFEKMTEGACVQIIHIGPYSTEAKTIEKMYRYINEKKLIPSGLHHEIYLSDPRGTAPEKLKTILRQPVKEK